jgi:uncharacterized membrane protein
MKLFWNIIEFILLLLIGMAIVYFITGSIEYTWIIVVVDAAQNLVMFAWFKWLRHPTLHWFKSQVKELKE